MADEKGFTAKKEIPAQDVDVKNGRAIITPPREEVDPIDPEKIITIPGTIDFQIDGVKPVEVTAKEMDAFWKWAIPIAGRAPNLKDITPELSATATQ